MSQPPQNPDGTTSAPGRPAPGWPGPDSSWPAPGGQVTPDWAATTPAWGSPAPAPAAAPAAPASASGRTRWVLAGTALAGVAAGAVAATLLVSAVFIGSAEDIGRTMAEEMTPAIAEGVRDGMVEGNQESMDALMGGMLGEEGMGWYAGGPSEDVEQFPPVAPEDLGPDGELDAYAQSCFEGDLQACDDLMYESPPLSAYEEYASTCGGRVKEFTVPACTELE
ncbi:hypothetical protein GCU60_17635 [Blastococcus saxobsidens]|uniref:Uncharacterized protein n=1 Tax=Blastococcus saxobsidens TaxID=138336 RepID=A0A6L9W639_9ACTN|nr:hypothetical protein [Blastococcus saxobsidens]NEK87563.1 hypothetical protein [Blastococcus saxobsidens]